MEQWWKQLFGVVEGQKVWEINQDRSMGMRIWRAVLALFWEFLSPANLITCARWKGVYVLIQSCSTLCDPMGCGPAGFSVHGILQARILEWVAISSSRGSSWSRDWTCVSYVSCICRWDLYHLAPPRKLRWKGRWMKIQRMVFTHR